MAAWIWLWNIYWDININNLSDTVWNSCAVLLFTEKLALSNCNAAVVELGLLETIVCKLCLVRSCCCQIQMVRSYQLEPDSSHVWEVTSLYQILPIFEKLTAWTRLLPCLSSYQPLPNSSHVWEATSLYQTPPMFEKLQFVPDSFHVWEGTSRYQIPTMFEKLAAWTRLLPCLRSYQSVPDSSHVWGGHEIGGDSSSDSSQGVDMSVWAHLTKNRT